MVLFTEAAFVVRTAAGDCAQCDAGYYDATDCDAYNWGCGSDCEGGAYWTDVGCGCACAPSTTAPSATTRPSTSPVLTPPICPAMCYGYSCDYWTGITCAGMEDYGCDCNGCDCATDATADTVYHGCVDTDNGASDQDGATCLMYAADSGYCGNHDDNDFLSSEMCCGCGGGSRSCIDTDDGATDPYGDGCDDYAANPSWCGGFDSIFFSSNAMCCGCGGGFASPVPSAVPTSTAPSATRAPTAACPETCYGLSCDYWLGSNSAHTCGIMESNFGCDCAGCECGSTSPPTATPTEPPTTTHTPTTAPTLTPGPSASSVPTAVPTPLPTGLPTTARPTLAPLDVEASTFAELDAAISQATASGANLIVRLLADTMVTATLVVASQVMLLSSCSEGVILRGGGSTRLFQIEQGGRLSGANITLQGGYSARNGGAILNSGTLTLANCILAENTATLGGGINSVGGDVSLTDCVLANNVAVSSGGAMFSIASATMTLNGCMLRYNSAERNAGGGISVRQGSGATTSLDDCVLTGNYAGISGGAMYVEDGVSFLENCSLTENSAVVGGALANFAGSTVLSVCRLTDNRAVDSDEYVNTGGALMLHYGAVASLNDCTLSDNSAGSGGAVAVFEGSAMSLKACCLAGNIASGGSGGAMDNFGSTLNLNECTFTDNLALNAGAVHNNGGAAVLNGCVLTNNAATSNGGAFVSFGGTITLTDCDLNGNSANGIAQIDAMGGGALYQDGGEITFKDCTLADNQAASHGAIVYSENGAITRFELCEFRGVYDSDDCVISSADEESMFLFYYRQPFQSGVVCSASPVLIYNTNVTIPLSSSHEAAMACQSDKILDYCKYDCASGAANVGGITCTCISDGRELDPFLLDDAVSGCMNSALLSVPETEFTLAVTKQRGPSSLKIVFANAGDKILIWNLTNIGASSIAEAWSIKPAGGYLLGCGVGTVEVALLTWNLTARANAYKMWLVLTSNSYRDSTYNISISAFVAAEPVPSRCSVNVTSHLSQLAAGNAVRFIVEPVDAAGVTILDTASQAYFANLEHSMSTTSVPCRVVYDPSSGQQEGACEIPTVVCKSDTTFSDCVPSPPVGEFLLDVEDADGNAVGATQHSFVIKNCPESYYKTGGGCSLCLDRVFCAAGSAVADWQLAPGDWRATPESTKVQVCRFGQASCPGDVTANSATGPDPYCAPEYVGPLCSECHPEYFLSWAGDGGCHKCATGERHGPTIGLLCGVVVLVLIAILALQKCKRKESDARTRTESGALPTRTCYTEVEKLYFLAQIKFFTLFLAFQVF